MTKPLTSLIGRSLLAPLKRFWMDDSGVTAIEFGILAPPFFAIIGAILETSIAFLAAQVMDSAVQDASRLVRTGQAQQANFTVAKFEDAICGRLFGLFQDCHALHVRVLTVEKFSSIAATLKPPITTDCVAPCNWTLPEQFTPGVGSNTEVVQVYYKWPLILEMFSFAPNDLSDGTRLFGTVQVFRNEPFS